ncbi:LysR family transcriptional regulator, partial [Marinobacter sp. 1Y8]
MKKSVQAVPKITLKQLAVFVSIYQTGSTSRASEELHLSQSAVSSALTELES